MLRQLLLLVPLVLLAAPAAADPPSWSGVWHLRERYHRPDGAERPVQFTTAIDMQAVARGLPYGFNRGTCDRTLIEAAAGRAVQVGEPLGRAMDTSDRECLWGALENLPDNRSIAWIGENGPLFRISTARTHIRDGAACRDWRAEMVLPAGSSQTFGTYCRRSDGQWVTAK